ncbi:MAG: alcohol dehydrogenase catalytic domain-containing protein [Candidatus Bipolaricaulota bacterium]|nr:MAG: alcohol dehydrogenase catalytic domain-containing protein [Candidatus Bipolaricaulota bacterium]
MKAAVLLEPRKIRIQDVEDPVMTDTRVLVRIRNCGICTLEQRLYTGDLKIGYPIVPGHEASGEIVEIGARVIGEFTPGMPVALDLITRCGQCYFCRTGRSNLCSNRFKPGQQVLGGFGEYIAVRGRQAHPVAENVSLREAAFVEPVACCIRSLKKLRVELGESVLIVGAGPMGIMHLQVARAMGARVFVSDPNAKRLDVARSLGAFAGIDPSSVDMEEAIRSETGGIGVDACVVTSPAQAALESGISALAKAGRLNIYTSYMEEMPLPMDANKMHRNESLITGSEGRTEFDFHQAVKLIGYGMVDVKPLISQVVGLESIAEGIEAAMSQDTLRVLLEP